MARSDRSLFFSDDGCVGLDQFTNDLTTMRSLLASASHVSNLLQDRYHFSLGIVAALLNEQTTVLPPSDAPEAIAASLADAAAPLILGGGRVHAGIARQVTFHSTGPSSSSQLDLVKTLGDSPQEIRVFTSGSTKAPESQVKTWGMLRAGASVTDQILRDLDLDPNRLALLGTTPPGHMFGLEATVFATLGFGHCSYRDTIFYPADLEAAIDSARRLGLDNLVLVTSPAHLRFLQPTIMESPEIRLVLSATAPLPKAQAMSLEARGKLKVMEIYGSTETGSMAYRRTAIDEYWTLAADFRLERGTNICQAIAPHLPAPVPLGDEIELASDRRFALLGRVGDTVSVRGKRNRISSLNAILAGATFIRDGVFLHVAREGSDLLAIAAVPLADGTFDETELRSKIRKHLLRYVDQAFVPKKILFLDGLGRSPTGKIPKGKIEDLVWQAGLANQG